VADYPALNTALARYRARGARIAVDDAGGGYASMRHVTELRPDLVKLDASLVRGLRDSLAQQAFLRAMQAFVREIGATLVAEGVEDAEDLVVLSRTGPPILVQGFAVAKPGQPWPAVAQVDRPVFTTVDPAPIIATARRSTGSQVARTSSLRRHRSAL
jgi:EAL domain-containing protein (putative c-di-GMP-specific phosphodiesterase class I)